MAKFWSRAGLFLNLPFSETSQWFDTTQMDRRMPPSVLVALSERAFLLEAATPMLRLFCLTEKLLLPELFSSIFRRTTLPIPTSVWSVTIQMERSIGLLGIEAAS